MIGAYLPEAEIHVNTLDPDSAYPCSRIDQPFTVGIKVSGLLTGFGFRELHTRVMLDHYLNSTSGAEPLPAAEGIRANVPLDSGLVAANGSTFLIRGISQDQRITGDFPTLLHALTDLYPRSDTSLMLYPRTSTNGVEGNAITAFPKNLEQVESVNLEVS